MSESGERTVRGVNVVGYHHVDSGLGVAARSITGSLRAAGVEVVAVDVAATDSPRRSAPSARSGALHDVTVAVVTAAQLPDVLAAHPEVVAATELMVGYWFWELATVPREHRRAIDLVDTIWAPTEFVAAAYRDAGAGDVEVQPLRLDAPQPSARTLDDFDVKTAMTTFLATFDYLSVAERKNPFGAIAAFRQAFPGDDIDAALVIKTLNGEQRPDAEQRVLDAAGSDRRITVVDEQFSDADQAALIAAVQCLVSLHRGEGLGLHIADAMWLGTPVLASRYGGSMDLLDDETAALVDVHLVPAERTEGAYPAGAMWADPVIDQAATWMRRMALEPYERARLADAARRRIAEQPSAEEVGRRMARSLGKPRLAVEAATAADRGRGLRRIGRMVTSPARGYINRHFEMTKEEIRLQVHLLAEHQAMTMARLGGTGQRVDEQQITELGNVVSEIGVHQTRVITALREEVAEVRRALDEMRDDIAVLTQALVHLAEPREAGDE